MIWAESDLSVEGLALVSVASSPVSFTTFAIDAKSTSSGSCFAASRKLVPLPEVWNSTNWVTRTLAKPGNSPYLVSLTK